MKYILLITLLLAACSGSESNTNIAESSDIVTININVEEAKPILMSEFFSGITYFPLSNPTGEPVGNIFKIMTQGDKIALYDRPKKSVWIYTDEGEYLNEVKIPQGQGPGELEHISDVYFDEQFNVHAMGAFKFVTLDMEGNLLNETQVDLFAKYFTYIVEDSIYFGFADGNPNARIPEQHKGYDLFAFNDNGKITNSYVPIEENKQGISYGIPNYFPEHDGQHYFFKHLDDTVYAIKDNRVEPAYLLDFGEQALNDEVFEKRSEYGGEIWQWTDFWESEIEPNDYIVYKSNVEITDRFIHTRVGNSNSKYMVLFDRDRKKTHVGEETFVNDIDNGPSPFIYLSSDEHLYSYVDAYTFLGHMNEVYENDREKYFSNEMSRLRTLANSMREESNPILMRLEFKK